MMAIRYILNHNGRITANTDDLRRAVKEMEAMSLPNIRRVADMLRKPLPEWTPPSRHWKVVRVGLLNYRVWSEAYGHSIDAGGWHCRFWTSRGAQHHADLLNATNDIVGDNEPCDSGPCTNCTCRMRDTP